MAAKQDNVSGTYFISLYFACHHWLRITFVYSNKTSNVRVNVTLRWNPVWLLP